ncbi:MAG: fibronectin type III domain-containing protein [Candidatus Coatesbacteria bacterium]|nr:fibronectin type III domain-containing protein [Candidatus Coatesbacteria bacterium]
MGNSRRMHQGIICGRCLVISCLSLAIFILVSIATAQVEGFAADPPPAPARNLTAKDAPNDDGGSILLSWTLSYDDSGGANDVVGYEIRRSTSPDGPFEEIKTVSAGVADATDEGVENDIDYYYQIVAKDIGSVSTPTTIGPVQAKVQWFNLGRLNTLIVTMVYVVLLLYFIFHAKKGKDLFVRRIAGLDALDEAVGRATEMGKPILYVPGISFISDVATIASLNILSGVARTVAEYNTRVIVPNYDPIVMTVAQEVVREGFLAAGKPDAYNEQDVFYVTTNQFAFVAAVDGIMVRERPATNLFIGMFYAESLILAETGASTGAIQIAGTDAVAQLPFFIAACDYTLIGEELYAASAYLSRAPLLMGSLKGQDWMKVFLMGCILIGLITIHLGYDGFKNLFDVPLTIFK